ncbi:arylsulfatase A-like enzyme [Microvirga lupini]|uniref:Arylsulfatase A-like enzyme n=1 Tax=Microvirga lupini TaxID=420324 RepID=A0A7W4YZZ4_9HYPH|nr:arylsulfatase A-like enzyme [Microvirga lupini]
MPLPGSARTTTCLPSRLAGPFDQWPVGMGFEYFYGFIGGDANQWQPNLFRNTTQIYPFEGKPPGRWNLVTAMADDAIDYVNQMHQIQPGKPILVKCAPGATHEPHHPTKEWVDKISQIKLFNDGWNKLPVDVQMRFYDVWGTEQT